MNVWKHSNTTYVAHYFLHMASRISLSPVPCTIATIAQSKFMNSNVDRMHVIPQNMYLSWINTQLSWMLISPVENLHHAWPMEPYREVKWKGFEDFFLNPRLSLIDPFTPDIKHIFSCVMEIGTVDKLHLIRGLTIDKSNLCLVLKFYESARENL